MTEPAYPNLCERDPAKLSTDAICLEMTRIRVDRRGTWSRYAALQRELFRRDLSPSGGELGAGR